MKIVRKNYNDLPQFSPLIQDFLGSNLNLNESFNKVFKNTDLELVNGFENDNKTDRSALKKVVLNQYKKLELSQRLKLNIDQLTDEKTFTVTTAHQPNLFTGPLYFIYKIISAINLAEAIQENNPNHNIIPVYWMGSEDHDFEEINHIHVHGETITWSDNQKGAVGKMNTDAVEGAINDLQSVLRQDANSKAVIKLLKSAYLNHNNLAEATRYLVNELFGHFGLVIIDGDDKLFKKNFKKIILKEALDRQSKDIVNKHVKSKLFDYNKQVEPRSINLFYMKENLRERLVFEEGLYKVLNTDIKFSKEEIKKEIDIYPERFSPNVILRPLYQEMTLPNLVFVGGAGEIAYWLQLPTLFEHFDVQYPVLFLRNSVLWIKEKETKLWNKLKMNEHLIFLSEHEIFKKLIEKKGDLFNTSSFQQQLEQLYNNLKEELGAIDQTLKASVEAEYVKSSKGLSKLEKKALRAQKRNQEHLVTQIHNLKSTLFPDGHLQERYLNFVEFYAEYGEDFIKVIKSSLNPLEKKFTVIVDED